MIRCFKTLIPCNLVKKNTSAVAFARGGSDGHLKKATNSGGVQIIMTKVKLTVIFEVMKHK